MPESADLEKAPSCDCCGHAPFVPDMLVEGWNLVQGANCGLVFTSFYSRARLHGNNRLPQGAAEKQVE